MTIKQALFRAKNGYFQSPDFRAENQVALLGCGFFALFFTRRRLVEPVELNPSALLPRVQTFLSVLYRQAF